MSTIQTTLSNPFPGLRPFRSDEHHLFFGREEQTAELLRLLRRNRFLAVVGTSGSGKSSLVRAGLIAELYSGTMTQAGSSWEVIILRPGGSPVDNLARAFIDADLYDADDPDTLLRLRVTLDRSRYGLVEAVKQSDEMDPGANLLVVVDQFEELFRFRQQGTDSEETAAAFVNLLLTASEQEERRIYVTITMRSDYLGDCSHIPGLAEAVNRGEYLIPRLLRDQQREAIEKPVGVGGAQISPLLVQRMLNQVGDDPDQLPVLQHALMRTWNVWSARGDLRRPIDVGDFEATGGLAFALSQHADEIFFLLASDAQKITCERLFKALTEKGADNRGIRRPARLAQLEAIVGADREVVIAVLEAYRQPGVTFLMPGMDTELTDRTVLDLSHESLMRGWERLRGWVEEEAQSARIYRRLLDTARLWQDGKAGLFRDPDLQICLSWREEERPNAAWANQYGGQFDTAVQFLDESQKVEKAEELAKEEARRRKLEQAHQLAETQRLRAEEQQRSATNLKKLVAGVAGLAVIAFAAFVAAWLARGQAQKNLLLAEKNALEAKANAELALEKEQQAQRSAQQAQRSADIAVGERQRAEQAADKLNETLTQSYFITANEHLAANQPERSLAYLARSLRTDPSYWPAAFQIMTLLSDRTFPLQPHQLITGQQPILFWGLNATKDVFWTEDVDSRGALWNAQTGEKIAPLAEGKRVDYNLFTDDGKLIYVALPDQDDAIQGFYAHTGKPATPVISSSRVPFFFVATHPTEGPVLLVPDSDSGALQVLNGLSGKPLSPPLKTDGKAQIGQWYSRTAGFSPDGTLAFGDFSDRKVGVWRVSDGTPVLPPIAHDVVPKEIKITAGARWLVIVSYASRAVIWNDLSKTPSKTRRATFDFEIDQHYFHAAGDKMVLAGWRQSEADRPLCVEVLDLAAGKKVVQIKTPQTKDSKKPEIHVANLDNARRSIQPWLLAGRLEDGRRLAAWDLHSGKMISEFRFNSSPLINAGIFPAAGRIYTVQQNHQLRVWDLFTADPLTKPMEHPSQPYNTFVTPDGEKITTFNRVEMSLRVWNSRTGELLTQPTVLSTAFAMKPRAASDRSQLINRNTVRRTLGDDITTTTKGELSIWRAEPAVLQTPPIRLEGPVGRAEFSPDGKRMLAFARPRRPREAKLQLYSVATRQIERVLEHPAPVTSASFSPDGGRLATASAEGNVRIWDLQSGEILTRFTLQQTPIVCKFGPRGDILFTSTINGLVRAWSAHEGYPLFPPLRRGRGNRSLAISPTGERFAVGSVNGQVRIVNSGDGKTTLLHPPHETNANVVISSDGAAVLSIPFGETARVWDMASEKLAWESPLPRPFVSGVFHPRGDIVALSAGYNTDEEFGWLYLWNWKTGRMITEPLECGGRMSLGCLRYSPCGRLLAAGNQHGELMVFEVGTGKRLIHRTDHTDRIVSVDFSADGKWLLSASRDHTIQLLELPPLDDPAPTWLAELAEAAARKRVNQEGGLEDVASKQLVQIRKVVEQADTDDRFTRWARWLLKHPAERPISPGSTITIGRYARQLSRSETPEEQHLALLLAPNDGVVYARLGLQRAESPRRSTLPEHTRRHWDHGALWYSDQAVELAPKSAEAWALRGATLRAVGRDDQAVEAIAAALKLDPKNPIALYAHALDLAKAGEQDAAYTAASTAIDTVLHADRASSPFAIGTLAKLAEAENLSPFQLAQIARSQLDTEAGKQASAYWEADWLTRRAAELAPENPEIWRLRSEVLFEPRDTQAALAAFKKAVALDEDGNPSWHDYGQFLRSRYQLLVDRDRKAEARAHFLKHAIPPRDVAAGGPKGQVAGGPKGQAASPLQIDLSASFNASLLEHPQNLSISSAPFDDLPTGMQTLSGVRFDVRGIVQLDSPSIGSNAHVQAPRKVTGIPAKIQAAWLHFLHSTTFFVDSGAVIGRYVLHYADGQKRELPLVYGRDVVDWWAEPHSDTEDARSIWSKNELSQRIFLTTWENPRPEIQIDRIDFESDMTRCAPFLLAITAEKPLDEKEQAALSPAELAGEALKKIENVRGLGDGGLSYADALSRRAIQADPDDSQIVLVRAKVLFHKGDAPAAKKLVEQLLQQNADHRPAWALKGLLAFQEKMVKEALIAFSRAIQPLNTPDNHRSEEHRRYVRQVTNWIQKHRDPQQARRLFLQYNVPSRDPQMDGRQIDLSNHYNAALSEGWYQKQNQRPMAPILRTLPRGWQQFKGVPFDVRGLIQLNDRELARVRMQRRFPRRVSQIQVGRKAHQIHLLHGGVGQERFGTPIAGYVIHYASGRRRRLPIIFGRDIIGERNLRAAPNLAWLDRAVTRSRQDAGLFLKTWNNPDPDDTITHVEFETARAQCQPFLVAMTVESFHNSEEIKKLPPQAAAQLALAKVRQWRRPPQDVLDYAKQLSDYAIAQAPKDAGVWRLRAKLLHAKNDFHNALAAVERAFELGEDSAQAWRLKADILTQLRRFEPAQLARAQSRKRQLKESIPARPTDADPRLLDLSSHYNASLEDFVGQHKRELEWLNLNYSALPQGVHSLGGVPFDLRGIIQLNSAMREMTVMKLDFPKQVTGVKVGRKGSRIHFLHAAQWAGAEFVGRLAARYVIQFHDGRTQEFPISAGREIGDWLIGERLNYALANGKRVWKKPGNPAGPDVGLFLTTWTNPWPDQEISHIDLVSAMNASAPFVVAITVDPP